MKKFFLIISAALVAAVSCQKEDGGKKSNDLLGEWKATKLEATFNNGNTLTITDAKDLESELEELYWFNVSENNIRPMNTSFEILLPYELADGYILFTGGEKDATYKIESLTSSEMIIKYSADWTSLIYYQKVK